MWKGKPPRVQMQTTKHTYADDHPATADRINSILDAQFDSFVFMTSSTDDLKSVPRVSVKVNLVDHDNNSKDGPRAVTVKALADTGASHCIISEKMWRDMGCDSKHLSPSSLSLGAANSTNIPVLGVATVKILVVDLPAHYTTTTAAICAGTGEEMFLSKSVLVKLGIVHNTIIDEKVSISYVSKESCACTVRTAAPAPPSKPPVALTEANRQQLQDYLLEYYASSMFNNCTHQKLPGMAGEPLRVHIDEKIPPTTVNRPSTVSVHWEKKVKAALDA